MMLGENYYNDLEAGKIELGEVDAGEARSFAKNILTLPGGDQTEFELADTLFRLAIYTQKLENKLADLESK